jgi:hypothetical protein
MTYNEYHSVTPPAMTGPNYKGGRRRSMRGGNASATGNMIKVWSGDYVPVNSGELFGPIQGGRRRRRTRGGDENLVPELVKAKDTLRPVAKPPPRDAFGRKVVNTAGRRTRRRRRFHTRRR